MQWRGRRSSSNIENRGRGSRGAMIGGGSILLGLLVFLLTGNPLAGLQVGMQGSPSAPEMHATELTHEEKELYDYCSVVLADTEDAWHSILEREGITYREPKLAIYQDQIQTGCGLGQAGIGPFYCSADETIYLDLSFYETLIQQFRAQRGDFILSYVLSHEVGHHVQNVCGVLPAVHKQRAKLDEVAANALSVRLELQADYLAGVVAHFQNEQGYLEPDDIEEAISAAWSIGDDTLQKNARGTIEPESFTHGTSEQRVRWYKKGYQAGDLSQWNTFEAKDL